VELAKLFAELLMDILTEILATEILVKLISRTEFI
jgi:hypothetical protein